MILNATRCESWDRCRRQWAYLEDWEMIRVTPLGSVYRALHAALQATDYPGPQFAREHVMREAAERGVWTARHDPYDQMVHHAHLAECLARVLRQPSDESRESDRAYDVGSHIWQLASYPVDGGLRLMRFLLVDHWDDDRQSAELHSWRTMGDVCVTGLPMTIRVAVIGQSRGGRRLGHWTRARRHPLNKGIRFARKHGKDDGLAGSWAWVWRETSDIGVLPWVEQMSRDGVLTESAFNVQVRVPAEGARQRVLEDIERIGAEMERHERADKHFSIQYPMTRSACDDPIRGPCPLQCVCYAPTEITPGETGMFRKRGDK